MVGGRAARGHLTLTTWAPGRIPMIWLSFGSSMTFRNSLGDNVRSGAGAGDGVVVAAGAFRWAGGDAGWGVAADAGGGVAGVGVVGADVAAGKGAIGPRRARTARINSSMLATAATREARRRVISINVRTLRT